MGEKVIIEIRREQASGCLVFIVAGLGFLAAGIVSVFV